MQVIVIGMHRSGTSMVTRLLNLCGLYFGPEGLSTGFNPENEKGFWERVDVRALNDQVLASMGATWDSPLPAFESKAKRLPSSLTHAAKRLLLEIDAHRPWVIKEPRLCLTFRFIKPLMEMPVAIIPVRDPMSVALSLHRRNKFSIELSLALWECYSIALLRNTKGLSRYLIQYEELLLNPYDQVAKLHAFLAEIEIPARMPSEKELQAFVDKRLNHNPISDQSENQLNESQARLWKALTEGDLERASRMKLSRAAWELLDKQAKITPVDPEPLKLPMPANFGQRSERLHEEIDAVHKKLEEGMAAVKADQEVRFGELRSESVSHADSNRMIAARIAGKVESLGEEFSQLRSGVQHSSSEVQAVLQDLQRNLTIFREATEAQENTAREHSQQVARLQAEHRSSLNLRDAMITSLESEKLALTQRLEKERANTRALTQAHQDALENERTEAEAAFIAYRSAVENSLSWKASFPLRLAGELALKPVERLRRRRHLSVIRGSDLFDAKWYLQEYKDVATAEMDAATHYLIHGALEGRNPGPQFDSSAYDLANPDIRASSINPLVHYEMHGRAEGRRKAPVRMPEKTRPVESRSRPPPVARVEAGKNSIPDKITSPGSKYPSAPLFSRERAGVVVRDMHGTDVELYPEPSFGATDYEVVAVPSGPCLVLPLRAEVDTPVRWPRIGVHLHLFYVDLLEEFATCLGNIPGRFHLFVSICDPDALDTVRTTLAQRLPRASIEVAEVPNRGRDIASFVSAFGDKLSQFDVVAHFHSKRSPHNFAKADWRRQLLTSLLGSPDLVHSIMHLFADNKSLGMIFPEYHESLRGQISWGTNFKVCSMMAQQLGLQLSEDRLALFPAGSMFWARTDAIRPILEADVDMGFFPEEGSQIDGTPAHAIERLFGECVLQQGFKLQQIKTERDYRLTRYYTPNWLFRPEINSDEWRQRIEKRRSGSRDEARPRVVVYTAIAGNYDNLLAHEYLDPTIDYIAFVDGPKKTQGVWELRQMDYWHPEPVRMARYVKSHPHKYFPNYDVAVWIDASVMLCGDIKPYVDSLLADTNMPLAGIPHPQRNCIYKEAATLNGIGKDSSSRIQGQVVGYQEAGYPANFGLIETNFLPINLQHEATAPVMDGWWREMVRHSFRDQLSLNYSLWEQKQDWRRLFEEKESVRNHEDFAYFGHGSNSGFPDEFAPFPDSVRVPEIHRNSAVWPPPERRQAVDIVVCVHNAPKETARCLATVAACMVAMDRLIIVDDCSSQPTAEMLDRFVEVEKEVLLLRNKGQAQGYCKSANQGMRATERPFVLLLNSDTELPLGALDKLVAVANVSPAVGVVGPMSNAASFQSIPDVRAGKNQTAINRLPEGCTVEDMDKWCDEHSTAPLFPSVPLVHGFCQLISREALKVVGLFDEDNFPAGYGEENDFCMRAVDAGFDLKIATNCFVAHDKSASYSDEERRAKLMREGGARLRAKHGDDRVDQAILAMEGDPLLVSLRQKAEPLLNKAQADKSP